MQGKITSLPPLRQSQKSVAAYGGDDASAIAQENDAVIAAMSREEILLEQERLVKRFGADALSKLQALKKKQQQQQQHSTMPAAAMPKEDGKPSSTFVQETFPVLTPAEQKKVQWMMEEEEDVTGVGAAPRLDLFGSIVRPDQEFDNELYHHAGPNVPGYTSEELIHLSRSTMSAQRAIAFRALAGLLLHRRQELVLQSASSSYSRVPLHQGQCLVALRMGLDAGEDATSLPCAIEALYHFMAPGERWTAEQRATRGLSVGYLEWGVAPRAQGSPLVFSPALEILTGPQTGVAAAAAEGESEDDEELNFVQMAEFSPTLALLQSNCVTRLCYLLGGDAAASSAGMRAQLEELLLLLVRHRSGAGGNRPKEQLQAEEDALVKMMCGKTNKAASPQLVLGLVTASKRVCQRLCRDTPAIVPTMTASLASNAGTGRDWRALADVVLVLRACVLQGELLTLVPGWVQSLAEIVEEVCGGGDDDDGEGGGEDCASASLDIITYFCQQQQQQEEKEADWFTRLQGVAQLAHQVCLNGGRLPRVSSSACRFLDAHARLLMLLLSNKPTADPSTDEQQLRMVSRSFNAVLIFLGGLLDPAAAAEDTKTTLEFWDGVKSCTAALTTFCRVDEDNARYFACNPLFGDLWQLITHRKHRRGGGGFPLTPLQGAWFLITNQARINLFALEDAVRAHQYDEERVPDEDWLAVVCEFIATDAGGHDAFTLHALHALLRRLDASSSSAGDGGGDAWCEELMPVFESIFDDNNGTSEDDDDAALVVCRALEVRYKLMQRVGRSWPLLPLLATRGLSTDVYRECARFALRLLRPLGGDDSAAAAVGCLLQFAGAAPAEQVDALTPELCALFDVAAGSSSFAGVLAVLEGPERMLALAQEVSRKLCEQLFDNAHLQRCVLVLLQRDFPVEVRLSVWNALLVGRALPQSSSGMSMAFGEEDEIFDKLADVVEQANEGGGGLDANHWIAKLARKQLDAQFASKPDAWLTKRLKARLDE